MLLPLVVVLLVSCFDTAVGQDRPCVCVPFYQCDDNNKVLVHGSVNILDPRIKPVEETCEDTEVCCDLPDENEQNNDNRGSSPEPEYTETYSSPATDTYPLPESDGQDPFILVPDIPDSMTGCGVKRITTLDTRIPKSTFNRIILPSRIPENTFFGEFPWMIGLYTEEEGKESFLCGASLIDPWVVMTAAHCLTKVMGDLNKLTIVAGDWNAVEDVEPIKPQRRKAKYVTLHERFNRGNLINDIALIFLEKEMFLSESVDNICVSQKEFEPEECFATGWGVGDTSEGSKLQPILRKVGLPIVDNPTCQNKLRDTRLGKYFKLHPSFICAGGIIHTDTCKGDGGGPLICSEKGGNPNRFAQVGIVSWGIDCGSDTPGVYTSVHYFYDWIKENLYRFSKSDGGYKLGGSL